MSVVVVVGTQWGDEGKGKIIDLLAERAHIVARYQGGNNAGHTVVIGEEEFILHLIPSGALYPDTISVMGNGMVIDPVVLCEEIDSLKARGIDLEGRLFVSDRAHVVLPCHKILDQVLDEMRGEGRIGTTGRGIGTCYVDKFTRVGIRMADFIEPEVLAEKTEISLREKNAFLNGRCGKEGIDPKRAAEEMLPYSKRMRRYVTDTATLLNKAVARGESILLESAQGALLDVDFGTYPYVTSSNPISGGASVGTGIPPSKIDRVLGVVKAYTTRVGEGPMPTELFGEAAERLRNAGPRGEYGATTGRPRRCGWFDAIVVRYSAMLNGLDYVAITRLDVLDDVPEIPMCVGYKYKGKTYDTFPALLRVAQECEPIYEEMPGWMSPTVDARRFKDLPAAARNYVERLCELVGVPPAIVSVGPRRDQTMVLKEVI